MSLNRRLRPNPPSQRSDSDDLGILNERILFLVFRSMKWDIQALCSTASVNHKLRAIVKRLLWRELCAHSAPRMIASLENAVPSGRIGGGWHTLAKLMFFCCGCEPTRNFKVSRPTPGHFVKSSRYQMGEKEDDLGIYRGVFKGFDKSKTRAYLIGRRVKLEERVRCPYCGAPEWSMTTAGLVPKSAARRLGSHHGALEYFVCVNGHMHGSCWLVPLSSDDNEDDEMDGSDDSDFDDNDGGVRRIGYDDRTATNGSMCSMGEEVVVDGPAK